MNGLQLLDIYVEVSLIHVLDTSWSLRRAPQPKSDASANKSRSGF